MYIISTAVACNKGRLVRVLKLESKLSVIGNKMMHVVGANGLKLVDWAGVP